MDSGGLIMRAKKENVEVFVFYVSVGGSRQFQNGQTVESDRVNEAIEASKYGGFKYKIGFPNTSTKLDGMLQKEIIEAIEDIVKEFKPTIVVIPYQHSYSQDHRAVATACISAFRPISQSLHHQPRMILEVEEPSIWPSAPSPNFYVDISEVFSEKIKLYLCHKSQVTKDISVRSPENLEALARYRGAEIGVKYAEAYNLLKGIL